MKHLIPISLVVSGAYLICVPLAHHTELVQQIAAMAIAEHGSALSLLPPQPLLFNLLPWLTGVVLVIAGLCLSFRTFREP